METHSKSVKTNLKFFNEMLRFIDTTTSSSCHLVKIFLSFSLSRDWRCHIKLGFHFILLPVHFPNISYFQALFIDNCRLAMTYSCRFLSVRYHTKLSCSTSTSYIRYTSNVYLLWCDTRLGVHYSHLLRLSSLYVRQVKYFCTFCQQRLS